jgi:hypothetical protein
MEKHIVANIDLTPLLDAVAALLARFEESNQWLQAYPPDHPRTFFESLNANEPGQQSALAALVVEQRLADLGVTPVQSSDQDAKLSRLSSLREILARFGWLKAMRQDDCEAWGSKMKGLWLAGCAQPDVEGNVGAGDKVDADEIARRLSQLRLIVGNLEQFRPVKRSRSLEARDAWIFAQCCDLNIPLKDTLSALAKKCKAKRWEPLDTIQGLRAAARSHAKRHGLNPPPKRQDK